MTDTINESRLTILDCVNNHVILSGVCTHRRIELMPQARYFWIFGDESKTSVQSGLVAFSLGYAVLLDAIAQYPDQVVCRGT